MRPTAIRFDKFIPSTAATSSIGNYYSYLIRAAAHRKSDAECNACRGFFLNDSSASNNGDGVWTEELTATLLPPTTRLFAPGLIVFGLFGWRRKVKTQA
jgi:hypothetical protein